MGFYPASGTGIARSVADLCSLVGRLEKYGVAPPILAMVVDTGTSSGKLMLNVFGASGQFEREIMLERQREGVAKAKAEGKYNGRADCAREVQQNLSIGCRGLNARNNRQAARNRCCFGLSGAQSQCCLMMSGSILS